MYHYRIEMEIKRERRAKPKAESVVPKGGKGKSEPPRKKELPKTLSQSIMLTLLPRLRQKYGFYGMVSDNRHHLYSSRDLNQVMENVMDHKINLKEINHIGEDEGEGVVVVSFRPTGSYIETAALAQKFAEDGNLKGFSFEPEFKQSLEAAMNALVRSFPQYQYVSVGRSSLIRWQKGDGFNLGGGLVAWKGISANIVMGWKPYLNVDIANCAFWVGKNVIDLLQEMFDIRRRSTYHPPPTSTDVLKWGNEDGEEFKVANQLSTCKFQYTTLHDQRKFGGTIKKIIPESVSKKTFMLEENGKSQKISINDYFTFKKGMPLKYPSGPCIQFGEKKFVPAEICTIKKGQSYNRREMEPKQTTEMLKHAKKNPAELKADIEEQVKNLDLANNNVLQSLEISIPTKMLEMKARVLPAPAVRYGTGANGEAVVITPGSKGEWQLYGNNSQFYTPAVVDKWGVILIDCKRNEEKMLNDFCNDLIRYGGEKGVTFSPQPDPVIWEKSYQVDKNKITKYFKQDFKGCKLVIVVLPQKNSYLYGVVKHAAEVDTGMLTQCVASPTIFWKPSPSTVQNILLKINSKAGGINHVTVPPLNKELATQFCNLLMECPILIMGADVTHPQTRFTNTDGSEFIPSYAAVTGSIDRTCMPFMTELRAQAKAERGAAEVIQDMEEIAHNFLETFKIKVGRLPLKILYLRDGVGDGQFPELLHKEMLGIRRACRKADTNQSYQPRITFVTVQKRHKMRIVKIGTETEQAPPGTVVDTEIVHTTENDFYLLSHHGLQGTSRPTRYHVLWDDSNFSKDQLQSMIYTLCYMYCRCTRSVSLPAPTYYAHLAAERAKKIMEGFEGQNPTKESLNAILKPVADRMKTHPMHFV